MLFCTSSPGFVVSALGLVRLKIQSGNCCQTNFVFLFIFQETAERISANGAQKSSGIDALPGAVDPLSGGKQ